MPPLDLYIDSVIVAGNGEGNYLNGANWDPADTSNSMTEVEDGIPIPLTIIISRNKKLKTGAKIGIIAAAWIVYLLMGLAGKAIQDNEQIHADSPQTSYSEQTTGGAK